MYAGLRTEQAEKLLRSSGFNEIPEKKVSLLYKILKNIISPIALMLLLASGLSFALGKTFDGNFILVLLLINIVITLWQENKADNAIKKLNEHLQQQVKVYRDGMWSYIASRLLVTGDVMQLSSGDVISADGKIIEANHVSVNESALTGESLPKDKQVGEQMFSGSFMNAGVAVVEVTATGEKTNFGKTLFSVERVIKKSMLEKDILSISKFLTVLSLIAVSILTIFFLLKKASFLELMTLDLSLVIAGIPISLPTVMTLIIEFGVLNLAKKFVIVRRLSALEDLANVNLLLTDKTGTLTKNKITVQEVSSFGGFGENDVLRYAGILALSESDNPIDAAISEKVKSTNVTLPAFEKIDFIPADSTRKRSTMTLRLDNKSMVISVGAPQIVAEKCLLDKAMQEKFDQQVADLAKQGFRTLAVAIGDGNTEEKMQLAGLLALSDTLRDDAKDVIAFLQQNAIGVTMVTGDNQAITTHIARQLGLHDKIVNKKELDGVGLANIQRDFFTNVGAFAEILPEDKFHLVQAAKKYFVVASNGDGVNDLPAIKVANVGMAVKNAVAALKSTADIVLLTDGIQVIRDAIIESRKIFERLYTYSLYRISESLRLIITITVLGILYNVYPLTALQIILIALLNDIPIISLASDRVNITNRPAKIDAKKRFTLSSLYGLVGVANSLLLFSLVSSLWHLPWATVQTMYFLKMTVSGHMLIYVAHTKERWWKFFPSSRVIWATSLTQLVATVLALSGFLMPGSLNWSQIAFVWIWSLFWMQVSEVIKSVQSTITKKEVKNI